MLENVSENQATRLADDADAHACGSAELPAFIGRYRVVERLGRGGQGDVYRAVHPVLGCDVVLKWTRARQSEQACQKVLDEGRILAQLDDPGLVRVLDANVAEGRPFVVFEYVRGRSLADVVRQERWPPRRAAAVVAALAATLERIHHKGVLHGDLKPANVLIDEKGKPRLLDFGLASLAQVHSTIAPVKGLSGTPGYMAPEQARGQSETLGPWTDVFGLGALLYHLLTQRPPVEGMTCWASVEQASAGQIVPPRKINPAIPRALARICCKALAADPKARYASASEMGGRLRSWLWRGRAVALLLCGVVLVTMLAWACWPGPRPNALQSALAAEGDSVREPLTGELFVRVWSVDGFSKVGLLVEQAGALPVRNKEQVQIEARLNQPAHVYLLWIDSEGTISPLYPWNDGPKLIHKDCGVPPPIRPPRAEVLSPPDAQKGWKMAGKSGLDTILLGARRTPLPTTVFLPQLVGQLPVMPFHHREEWAVLRRSNAFAGVHERGAHRGPEEAEQIDHPIVGAMGQLRQHFEVLRAVRFAHAE
jgi:predicted Ser/Thr protein kinase